MITIKCTHCNGEIQAEESLRPKLCPYCGKPFDGTQKPKASGLETRLAAERDPKKKYKIIQEALSIAPDDFEANKALLFHGRLHEPMRGRAVDFSIIKCYLLRVFDQPGAYTQEKLDEMFDELLRGPQLQITMALAPDGDVFLAEYLRRLAYEYIDLFIRGDSKYSRVAFGFSRSLAAMAQKCAVPVRNMLDNIQDSGQLDDTQRLLLYHAVRDGFAAVFPGSAEELD